MNSLKHTLARTLQNIQTTSSDSESYYSSKKNVVPNIPHHFNPSHLPNPQNMPLHSMPPPSSASTRFSSRNNNNTEYVPGDVRYRPTQNTQCNSQSGSSRVGSSIGGAGGVGTGTYPTNVSQTMPAGAASRSGLQGEHLH